MICSDLSHREDLDEGVSWAFCGFLWSRSYEATGNSDLISRSLRARRCLIASACLLVLFRCRGGRAHLAARPLIWICQFVHEVISQGGAPRNRRVPVRRPMDSMRWPQLSISRRLVGA